jgi:hypothetical protein
VILQEIAVKLTNPEDTEWLGKPKPKPVCDTGWIINNPIAVTSHTYTLKTVPYKPHSYTPEQLAEMKQKYFEHMKKYFQENGYKVICQSAPYEKLSKKKCGG